MRNGVFSCDVLYSLGLVFECQLAVCDASNVCGHPFSHIADFLGIEVWMYNHMLAF